MTTLKVIDRKIASFTTNRVKLAALGHEIAMMIFDHAKAHGDTTRGLSLAQQMPKSWKSQLETWFKTYSPIRVVEKNGKHGLDPSYKKLEGAEKEAAWQRDLAAANPFHSLAEPDPDAKDFNLEAILKMLEQAAKRIESGLKKNTEMPEAERNAATSIMRKLTAIKPDVPAANDKPAKVRKPKVVKPSHDQAAAA